MNRLAVLLGLVLGSSSLPALPREGVVTEVPCGNSTCRYEPSGFRKSRHDFIKVWVDADGRKAMFTAAKTYVAIGKPPITLVAATHVGTFEYFRRHQDIIDQKNTVLYEMPYNYVDAGSCRELMQASGLESQLLRGLLYQYEFMLYRPHFQKADLFNKDLAEAFKQEQYRDMSSIDVCNATKEKLLEKTPYCKDLSPKFPLLCHVLSTSMFPYSRRSPADQNLSRMKMMEGADKVQDGEEWGQWKDFVISQREAHVKEMVRNILKSEATFRWTTSLLNMLWSGAPSIAILYGADHMPSFERFLCMELGYKLETEEWVEAFSAVPDLLQCFPE